MLTEREFRQVVRAIQTQSVVVSRTPYAPVENVLHVLAEYCESVPSVQVKLENGSMLRVLMEFPREVTDEE